MSFDRRVTSVADDLLDGVVVALALWTVTYHVAVARELSRDTAAALWVVLLAAAAVAAWRFPTLRRAGDDPPVEQPAFVRREWVLPLVTFGVGTAVAAAVVVLEDAAWWVFWAGALATVGGGLALALSARSGTPRVRPGRRGIALVLVAAAAFAALSALSVRPDSDDVYLVHRSVSVEADGDEFPTRDTIFADETFRSTRPEGSDTAFEPLLGVIARFTPFSAPTVAYLGAGPAVAALSVLALWRLLRTLRAPAPALACAAAALFLLLDGSEHASFGNFSFARSWQGKVVFVGIVVPLIWHHGLSWAREGKPRSAAGLVAANVASVGLTTSAGFVAPLVTGAAVLSGVLGTRPVPWARLSGAAAAFYPAGFALTSLSASKGPGVLQALGLGAVPAPPVAGHQSSLEPASQWYLVFGDGLGMAVAAGAVLLAWLFVRDRAARIALSVAPLVVVLLLTPGVLKAVNDMVSSRAVLWRVIWLIPVPAAVGVVLTAPLLARPTSALRWLGAVASVALLVAVGVAETPVVATDNAGTRMDGPAWDLEERHRRVAGKLLALSEPGDVVTAPVPYLEVIAVTRADVFTVNPRDAYMRGDHTVPSFHADARLLVSHAMVDGLGDGSQADLFRRGLDLLSVDTVCSQPRHDDDLLAQLIVDAGFTVVDRDRACTYWRRG